MNGSTFQCRIIFFEFQPLGVVAFVLLRGVARGRLSFLARLGAFERDGNAIAFCLCHCCKIVECETVVFVRDTRFELVTSTVSRWRSNQLS